MILGIRVNIIQEKSRSAEVSFPCVYEMSVKVLPTNFSKVLVTFDLAPLLSVDENRDLIFQIVINCYFSGKSKMESSFEICLFAGH